LAKKNFLKKGVFITFEGPEGSGKSTHARLLFEFLKKRGLDCIFTREPGGTLIGDRIREILLERKNVCMNSACELFLFEASRAQIVDEVIMPALEKGRIVVCDRFYDATVAYQGFGAGFDIDLIKSLNAFATMSLKPDLTILLDIGPEAGLKRSLCKGKHDRMESKSLDFHRKVRHGYLKLAKDEPKRIKVFKSHKTINEIQNDIRKTVLGCLSKI